VTVPAISAHRLELVSMSPEVLVALLERRREDAQAMLGAAIAQWWPDAVDTRFLRVRLEDMRRDPGARPWLLRALVRRGTPAEMVGHAGFHGPPSPDAAGGSPRLELGYAVFPAFQGCGYATEAAAALMAWAQACHGIRHFVASIGPGNGASQAIVRRLGFIQTGEQWDDEDGLELVFECQL
jgi:RimJ/RimL family protein N-acetyltransferase